MGLILGVLGTTIVLRQPTSCKTPPTTTGDDKFVATTAKTVRTSSQAYGKASNAINRNHNNNNHEHQLHDNTNKEKANQQRDTTEDEAINAARQRRHGVEQIDRLPLRSTSHPGVYKQQLVAPFTLHPSLAGISIGILENSQQTVERHQHDSMSEFFFVLQGQGSMELSNHNTTNNNNNDKSTNNKEDDPPSFYTEYPVRPGSFVFVGPHVNHSLSVTESSNEPLRFLYIGLTDTDAWRTLANYRDRLGCVLFLSRYGAFVSLKIT